MTVTKTKLKDCFIIEPTIFGDSRGYFFESYNKSNFDKLTGLDINFIQDNEAFSKKGALRGLHFQKDESSLGEYCPFLVDEQNVIKIRKAKDIIIANIAEPPSLQELANNVGLNIKKLKEGFKQIYGTTVYGFLFDYKMELARKLLESRAHNVNEVGLKVGYSTASHFIAAFKKQYGITPKKYIQSSN